MRGRRVSREWAFAFVILLCLALSGSGAAIAADGPASDPRPRYAIRAVRIEPQAGSVIYRLDSTTGEVCVFTFGPRGPGEARGCLGAGSPGAAGRFGLEAVHGVRGTTQTSAYRLDLRTGEICRYRLSGTSGANLEAMGCVPHAGDDAAR